LILNKFIFLSFIEFDKNLYFFQKNRFLDLWPLFIAFLFVSSKSKGYS
jgi:hypothetical protein